MSLQERGEYMHGDLPDGRKAIFARTIEHGEESQRQSYYGITRYVSIEPEIFGQYVIAKLEKRSPYWEAMLQILEDEHSHKIEEGSYDQAFETIIEGTFDDSIWAQYMRQSGD